MLSESDLLSITQTTANQLHKAKLQKQSFQNIIDKMNQELLNPTIINPQFTPQERIESINSIIAKSESGIQMIDDHINKLKVEFEKQGFEILFKTAETLVEFF